MGKRDYRDIISSILMTAVVLAILFAAQAKIQSYPEAGTGEFRLPVFETSDVHGNLTVDPTGPQKYILAFVADKVNDARRTEDGIDPDRTILLDGGDIYQGTAVSLLLNGEPMSAAYDAMGYDAVAIGNHEFDWGLETVIDKDQTMRDYTEGGSNRSNEIPVVCSDLYQNGEKISFARDYVILEKTAVDEDGSELVVRVAVIGFAEDYSNSIPASLYAGYGYSIVPDFEEANRLAAELESSGKCDATIFLIHGDAGTAADSLGESTCVDLVLGGHTHDEDAGETDWGLRYATPKGKCFAYISTDLVFEHDGKGGARLKEDSGSTPEVIVINERDSLLDTEENKEDLDREVIDVTNDYIDRTDEIMNEVIGYITVRVTRDILEGCDRRVSVSSNWVMRAMKRGSGADVIFTNKTNVRGDLYLDGKDRREVTLGDVFEMLPFYEDLYYYEMTYEDLLSVFRYSLSTNGWSLLTCTYGIDCYFTDDPDSKGSAKFPSRIPVALVKDGELIYENGKWKEGWKDKKVTVATVEFAATTNRNKSGMDNPLFVFKDTDKLLSHELKVRDIVIQALRDESEENNGLLEVDTEPHYIYHEYDGPDTL